MSEKTQRLPKAKPLIECFEELRNNISGVPGLEITHEPPSLRHFTAKLKVLD